MNRNGIGALARVPGRHDEIDGDAAGARTARVAARFKDVMEALGLDLSDPNLADTPARVARAYGELFSGLEAAEPDLRTFPNTEGYAAPVVMTNIPFHSLCAHHFLPFFGHVHVAYSPRGRVVGLSKLARVVDFYARRPQIQERLTEQIAGLLDDRLRPQGVLVIVEARHFCMEMRGVRTAGAQTATRAVRGAFTAEPARAEVLRLVRDHAGAAPPGGR